LLFERADSLPRFWEHVKAVQNRPLAHDIALIRKRFGGGNLSGQGRIDRRPETGATAGRGEAQEAADTGELAVDSLAGMVELFRLDATEAAAVDNPHGTRSGAILVPDRHTLDQRRPAALRLGTRWRETTDRQHAVDAGLQIGYLVEDRFLRHRLTTSLRMV
jgi:hypothetical protein